ncbi:MAG: hypothetical protein HY051_04240 [Candidatus Aenigmarchaeota archaeon]|nr:hypothetical protein [Candidatus Aenigmarchaeota archaeon]
MSPLRRFTTEDAEVFIIRYLLLKEYIGHRQTTEENLLRHVPAQDKKTVSKAINSLEKNGWFSMKRKHYGVHVSILPDKLDEIRAWLSSKGIV